ncbi:MAG: hypothetical protein NTY64_04555 [Deltaproteobacteria bacterium]|nr:hypothetical protein [Deltaproteobacteria bacterium]
MEKDIPPMLAAQSDFPSGPLPSFHKYSINEFGDDPRNFIRDGDSILMIS